MEWDKLENPVKGELMEPSLDGNRILSRGWEGVTSGAGFGVTVEEFLAWWSIFLVRHIFL